MKKIAFYLPSLAGGGAERVILFVVGVAAARGFDVDLVVANAQGPYLHEIPEGVNLIDFKVNGSLHALPYLVSYLRRVRPQALLSALERANVAAVLARIISDIPFRLVISERTHISSQNRFEKGFWFAITPFMIKKFYPKADALIAISNGVADDLGNIAGKKILEKTKVIYNPARLDHIRTHMVESVDHPWFNGREKIIITVGRLALQKDHETLLRAFSLVNLDIAARLIILGEGDLMLNLQKLAADLGVAERVWMPGFVPNPWKYMSKSNVFALSSLWEGFGNVLVEALACGLPIVSTDCPSGPSEILGGGQIGILVRPGDVNGMAEGLALAFKQPERLMNPMIVEQTLSQFNPEIIADKYIKVILNQTIESSH